MSYYKRVLLREDPRNPSHWYRLPPSGLAILIGDEETPFGLNLSTARTPGSESYSIRRTDATIDVLEVDRTNLMADNVRDVEVLFPHPDSMRSIPRHHSRWGIDVRLRRSDAATLKLFGVDIQRVDYFSRDRTVASCMWPATQEVPYYADDYAAR